MGEALHPIDVVEQRHCSKGLLERAVILRHAVKNALIPVVSRRDGPKATPRAAVLGR